MFFLQVSRGGFWHNFYTLLLSLSRGNEYWLGREIAVLAARSQMQPKDVAKNLAESGRVRALAADIMRRKALDYLVGTVNVNENEGNP